MNKSKKAFTLVELLVVIAIIGMLVAILLPAVQSHVVRRRSQCQNSLKQMGIAIISYDSAHSSFPPGATTDTVGVQDGKFSGLVDLLPYIEEQSMHDRIDLKARWNTPGNNLQISKMVVDVYQCPSSNSQVGMGVDGAASDYAFSKGPQAYLCATPLPEHHGMFDINSQIKRAHVKDGLSNTLAMGEAASSATIEGKST